MSDTPNIKDIIRQEYIKCAQDPVHFMRKYGYIQHPVRGRILFNLYPFQEKVLYQFQKDQNCIVLKSRQLGISTLVAGYSLWLMLFNKDKNIVCIATKQETAKNMVTKVSFMYENLPSWLRGNEKPLENNKLSLKLSNGSKIKAVSSATDAGRSEAVSLLIFDESSFIENMDTIFASAQQTISTGGKIIALSTPNGVGNWFHRTWQKAEIGENSFVPIRLPWTVHPERDQKWRDQQDADLGTKLAAQECDGDFMTSGDTVFEADVLKFYEDNQIQNPIEKRGMDGNLWVWEIPDYSKSYIVSADVARGDGKDYSTAHVIELESLTQVAEYRGLIGTRDFGNFLVGLASEYNDALLAVENANIGWDVVQTVIDRGYKNLYYSSRTESFTSEQWNRRGENDMVPGHTTSAKTRPIMIEKVREYVGEKLCILHSKRLIEEMKVFSWKNGKAQAQEGYNDDLIMALAIAFYLRDTAIRFKKFNIEQDRAMMNSIYVDRGDMNIFKARGSVTSDPWSMSTSQNNSEDNDLTWLLG